MGFMKKVAGIADDQVRREADAILDGAPAGDGSLHALVVGVASGASTLGAFITADAAANRYLNGVLDAMRERGIEVVSVLPARSDGKSQSFLITYR